MPLQRLSPFSPREQSAVYHCFVPVSQSCLAATRIRPPFESGNSLTSCVLSGLFAAAALALPTAGAGISSPDIVSLGMKRILLSQSLRQSARWLPILAVAIATISCNGTGSPSQGGGGNPSPASIASLNPTSGLVGASVTISGANFGATQGTSTVKFNGTAATPTSRELPEVAWA
jgi:hypothetical protein